MKNPVDFFYDIDGSNQYKIQIDPVILKPGRYSIFSKQAAYKKVGINYHP